MEYQPRHFGQFGFVSFLGQGLAERELALDEDVRETGVDLVEQCVVERPLQAEHEVCADVAHAVIHAVEPHNFLDGVLDPIGQTIERHVFFADHAVVEQPAADELVERRPVVAARLVQQDHRHHVVLAGLQQREHFEALVECTEPAGHQTESVALLDEHQLAGEEVLHVDQLAVAGDDRVCVLLEGEEDVQPHRVVASRAGVARLHDPAGRAGDYQPVVAGHRLAEPGGLLVGRLTGQRSGRTEHRHLANVSVRRKNLEGVAQLAERAADYLQVAAAGPVDGQFVGRVPDRLDQFGDPFRR